MAKTLSFTDTSPQTVKIGDTTTSFTLICGDDNVATDLTNVLRLPLNWAILVAILNRPQLTRLV
ncbi:hypothetical protein ACT5GY_06550 [Lactiplantibacillus plantarum]